MKRCLITGGAGFIGSNLALALQEKYPDNEYLIIDNFISGSFYNLKQALLLSLPYLLFGLVGLKSLILKARSRTYNKNHFLADNGILPLRHGRPPAGQARDQDDSFVTPIIISFLVTLPIIVFNFFFSHRFIPFADIFLILLSGYGVVSLFKGKRILSIIYAGLLVIFIIVFIRQTAKPWIFPDELREIQMLSETEPEAYVLATDPEYTPWIFGWSNRKTIAPGYGEYDIYWTEADWRKFWAVNNRETEKGLLLKLPNPLYIYHGDKRY
jgi:hypothetical protein